MRKLLKRPDLLVIAVFALAVLFTFGCGETGESREGGEARSDAQHSGPVVENERGPVSQPASSDNREADSTVARTNVPPTPPPTSTPDPRRESGDPLQDGGSQQEPPEDPDAWLYTPDGRPNRDHGDKYHGIWPEIWSQHAPGIKSWEYKVNCGEAQSHEDPCFLSDLTAVVVTTPSGEKIELEKDFNTNDYSGEVTRRWVLYGPEDDELPERGDYVYSYHRGDETVYEQVVSYDSGVISYPTGVAWERSGSDIFVTWKPPAEAAEGMHYKALIWQVEDTPEMFISDIFDWDADTAVLEDVPMIVGGKYSLNVAIYFDNGYAYSEYVIFDWPELAQGG